MNIDEMTVAKVVLEKISVLRKTLDDQERAFLDALITAEEVELHRLVVDEGLIAGEGYIKDEVIIQEGVVVGAIEDDEVELHVATEENLVAGAEATVQEGVVEGITPPDGFTVEEDEVSLHVAREEELVAGPGFAVVFDEQVQAYNIVKKPIIK